MIPPGRKRIHPIPGGFSGTLSGRAYQPGEQGQEEKTVLVFSRPSGVLTPFWCEPPGFINQAAGPTTFITGNATGTHWV